MHAEQAKGTSMKDQVTEIVAAYVRKNAIATNQLPALITAVAQSLAGLGQGQPPSPPEPLRPAIAIRRSISPDAVTCLDCGYKAQMLKRHLSTMHKLTVDDYRAKWSLPPDYPMVAPNYAAHRSALAKSLGLGTRNSRRRKS
jgi:predicted transcriptional regulator